MKQQCKVLSLAYTLDQCDIAYGISASIPVTILLSSSNGTC